MPSPFPQREGKNKVVQVLENLVILDVSTKTHPNLVTIISLVDLDRVLVGGRWKGGRTNDGILYITRAIGCGPDKTTQLLHRFIMNEPKCKVDHISGNTLVNCRVNLRLVTDAQNAQNRAPRAGTSSKFKGVYWYNEKNSYKASIKVKGKSIHLGTFHLDEEAAARAYDHAAIMYFGEYAATNESLGLFGGTK